MKKVFTILAISITTLSTAQESIGSYAMSYFEKENYDIAATKPKSSGDFSYYIDVCSRDSSIKNVTLSIESDDIVKFKEALNKAKMKYDSWSKTAKENNVTTLDKTIEGVRFYSCVAFLYGTKWQFDFSVSYKFRAKIIENHMYLIIQNKSEMVSSSNQFMKSDGFLMVFKSLEEIDAFLHEFDDQKVREYFNKKGAKEDLFE